MEARGEGVARECVIYVYSFEYGNGPDWIWDVGGAIEFSPCVGVWVCGLLSPSMPVAACKVHVRSVIAASEKAATLASNRTRP